MLPSYSIILLDDNMSYLKIIQYIMFTFSRSTFLCHTSQKAPPPIFLARAFPPILRYPVNIYIPSGVDRNFHPLITQLNTLMSGFMSFEIYMEFPNTMLKILIATENSISGQTSTFNLHYSPIPKIYIHIIEHL